MQRGPGPVNSLYWVSRDQSLSQDQSRDRQSMISILFLISKVLVLILILISELLISEFSLEISSRSTLLLCKISYKKLLKLFTNRQKRDSMERIHPGDTHGLRTSIFISFFNFRLGPGVYTAALEKCMHAHSWTENQAAKIQLSVVLILISDISDLDISDLDISDLDLRDSDLDLDLGLSDLGLDLDLGPSCLGPNTGTLITLIHFQSWIGTALPCLGAYTLSGIKLSTLWLQGKSTNR